MKFKDLSKKKEDELNKLLGSTKESLRVFRFGISGSRTKNVKLHRDLRRDVAKILTAIGKLRNSEE